MHALHDEAVEHAEQPVVQSVQTLEVGLTNCDAVQDPHLLAVSPSVPVQAAHEPSVLIPFVASVQVVHVAAAVQVAHPDPHAVQVPALEKNVGLHSVHVVMAAGHFRQLVES